MNKTIMNNNSLLFSAIVLASLTVICLLIIFFIQNRKKSQEEQLKVLQSILENFQPTLGIEKNLDWILAKLQRMIEVPNYSFYIYNQSNQRYTLKAVHQLTSDSKIAPSYSGLLPYEKEKFEPPLSLPKKRFPSKTSIIREGEIPLLTVPIKGEQGIIQIGPIKKVPKQLIQRLDILGDFLSVPLFNLLKEEAHRRNYDVLETSTKAVKYIHHLFIHEIEFLILLIKNSIKHTSPEICLLFQNNNHSFSVPFSYGMSKQTIQMIKENNTVASKLHEITGGKAVSVITDTNSNHSKVTELLSGRTGEFFILHQFSLLGKDYTFIMSFTKGSEEIEKIRSQHVFALWNQISHFVDLKQGKAHVSDSFIEFLKSIADIIDLQSPTTVGYSKLMSRYSMTIAKQMGLSEYQIQCIGLAAYLSNIGIIGLSDELLTKEGKYSEEEYEEMKLHSEIGAAIIENTIAESKVASYVRYHHERMDGNGYPSGLMGNEIPLGARIIAVVQTFLAKINGRSYRDALPFNDAMELLQNASGSQLDEKVVTVFLSWYQDKRHNMNGLNKALGNCWDLCSTPASICSQCPAFGQSVKNCWEFEKNNCLAHGKSCQTCFVYTEARTRERISEVIK